MKSDHFLKLFQIITFIILNIQLISCSDNLDLELDITDNLLNSENIIIDLSKKLNFNNNYYIKIISYEKEFELYSTKNPNKKIEPGELIPIEDKLLLKLVPNALNELNPNKSGKIEYSLINKYHKKISITKIL